MTLASWKQVETEASRIAKAELRTLANRADIAPFIWAAPHLEVDVAKQPIDAAAIRKRFERLKVKLGELARKQGLIG